MGQFLGHSCPVPLPDQQPQAGDPCLALQMLPSGGQAVERFAGGIVTAELPRGLGSVRGHQRFGIPAENGSNTGDRDPAWAQALPAALPQVANDRRFHPDPTGSSIQDIGDAARQLTPHRRRRRRTDMPEAIGTRRRQRDPGCLE
ncbi:MAG: hypothetical protein QXD60_04820 [Nanopusillaceae archaeon]